MAAPLVIACVKWGERFGPAYANRLYDGLRRHLPKDVSWRFECFTDDPSGLDSAIVSRPLPGDLTGWWNKLYLFHPDVFEPDQRILYFDLDTLILGSLEMIAAYDGALAALRDFYRPHGLGSGVLAWRGEAGYPIWRRYEAEGRPVPQGGDQGWLEIAAPNTERLQDRFPGLFVSFKTDCRPFPPPEAKVLCFHGEPKQDNCEAPWVREYWLLGSSHFTYATREEEKAAYRRHAAGLAVPWLQDSPAHMRHGVLVGGGATLAECEAELRSDSANGYEIFAINRAAEWLDNKNIRFRAQVVCDAHKEAYVASGSGEHYCADACHPEILKQAHKQLALFQPVAEAGSTSGLQSLHLAWRLGYRHFHLYGFDSCHYDGTHHAYRQPESDGDRVFSFDFHGRRFRASAWMLRQAEEFGPIVDRLLAQGATFSIHGDGLLHYIATLSQR